MRTKKDRLMSLNDECRLLGEKENELRSLIDQTEKQLTQVIEGIRLYDVINETLIKLLLRCSVT